jgi:hypothetical protein
LSIFRIFCKNIQECFKTFMFWLEMTCFLTFVGIMMDCFKCVKALSVVGNYRAIEFCRHHFKNFVCLLQQK